MKRGLALMLALGALLGGCDQDPFGLARRTIRGKYQLEEFEDVTYLQVAGVDLPTGYTGGPVDRIGWNRRFILAHHLPGPGSERDEWVIVDMDAGSYDGPFTAAELAGYPEVRGIVARPVDQAFGRIAVRPASIALMGLGALLLLAVGSLVVAAGSVARRTGRERPAE